MNTSQEPKKKIVKQAGLEEIKVEDESIRPPGFLLPSQTAVPPRAAG